MADEGLASAELADLRERLAEANETLRAIRAGEVDAVIVHGEQGAQVYTLQSADQPYRALIEQMREGAAILTAAGDVLYCNSRFAELVGLPLEKVIGSSIDRFIDVRDRDAFAALVRTRTGAQRGRLVAHDGPSRDVYFSWTVTVHDRVERRGLIVTDLTDLLDAQADRDRARRENRAKDEFLAMLAHELRNPLGAIAGAVQVLDVVGGQEGPGVRARGVITRQVQHLARLIDDLLDVGRLATGKIVLDEERIDLADVVRRAIAALAADGRMDKRLEVNTEPVWIDADPTRIEQIVSNLIANAIKYTEPGGLIRVRVMPDDRDAVLRIEDDGSGIDAELLPRIFDLFVQGEQTLDRSRGGLGIGLTLVDRLVKLHGGTVTAASAGRGHGSTFTVRLPSTAAARDAAPADTATQGTERRRIVIIEDNADSREMYRVVLELAGHEVLEAADAVSGLELLKSERPDVAFIDIGLPGLNGYDLVRRFRAEADHADVLLVALTGYGSPDDRALSREAGFDHHLMKPVSPDTLRELLNGELARPEKPRPLTRNS